LNANQNEVYLNGSRLVSGDDFNVLGDDLTLTSAAAIGDILVIKTQSEVLNAGTYTKAESDSRYVNYTGDIINGNLQVVGEVEATTFVGDGSGLTGISSYTDSDTAAYLSSGGTINFGNSTADFNGMTVTSNGLRSDGNILLRVGGDLDISSTDGVRNIRANAYGSTEISYAGSVKLETTNTGIDVTGTVTADSLGIGTTGPSDKLHISDSAGAYARISGPTSGDIASGFLTYHGSDLAGGFYVNPSHDMTIIAGPSIANAGMNFRVANATRMNISGTSGRVGIGLSNALYPLVIQAENPNNGIMQQLRNASSSGNGAFLNFDINNVGDFSIGMNNNTNALDIVRDLGNTGTVVQRYNVSQHTIEHRSPHVSRDRMVEGWFSKAVSTTYIDFINVATGASDTNPHEGFYYEIVTFGGDWGSHSGARVIIRGFVNGYDAYQGHYIVEHSGPYGAQNGDPIHINVTWPGNNNVRIQMRLNSGSVTLRGYVRLIGVIRDYTIY
jgi:hypothetical protein